MPPIISISFIILLLVLVLYRRHQQAQGTVVPQASLITHPLVQVAYQRACLCLLLVLLVVFSFAWLYYCVGRRGVEPRS